MRSGGENEQAEVIHFYFRTSGLVVLPSCLPSFLGLFRHLPSENVDAVVLGPAVFHNAQDGVIAFGDILRKKDDVKELGWRWIARDRSRLEFLSFSPSHMWCLITYPSLLVINPIRVGRLETQDASLGGLRCTRRRGRADEPVAYNRGGGRERWRQRMSTQDKGQYDKA